MLKGDIGIASVASVAQLCCQEKKSGSLSLHDGKAKIGHIYLENGQIIAARTGDIRGEKAFCKLLMLKNGRFIFEDNVSSGEREINASPEYLFLEAARHEDEAENYLERIKKGVTGEVERVEQVYLFEGIYDLLSRIGKLLEGGQIECLWSKEGNDTRLFLETDEGIVKIVLSPHAILEEALYQATNIKDLVEKEE